MTPIPSTGTYLALLERIHEYLLPRTYVEIGFSGQVPFLDAPGTPGIGIDPAPNPLPQGMAGDG